MFHAGGFDAATDELTTAIVAGCCSFAKGAPLRDLPVAALVRGVGFDPFENFAVALPFGDLRLERLGINSCEPKEALVNRARVVVFAVFAGDFRAALVQHSRQNDITAEAGAATAGRMNGEVGSREVDHGFVMVELVRNRYEPSDASDAQNRPVTCEQGCASPVAHNFLNVAACQESLPAADEKITCLTTFLHRVVVERLRQRPEHDTASTKARWTNAGQRSEASLRK